MKTQIKAVHDILDGFYPPEISFLEKRDPFQFLISVVLSAQTTDERVNQVTPALFGMFTDASSLASADIEEVKAIIRPTGFFNAKARHIIDCAKAIEDRFGGIVPVGMEELLTLPGVGRKTANCLRANVFGLPGIVVDTHFSRVVNRVFGLGTRDPEKVETRVALAFPDVYDLGVPNLGLAIFYDQLNRLPVVWAERVYLPWEDMEAEMEWYLF